MYPAVIKVAMVGGYRLLVEFDNRERGTLDMSPYLDLGVFSRLWDPGAFRSVRVAFDTLEWAGGIDLDPHFVYEKCLKETQVSI